MKIRKIATAVVTATLVASTAFTTTPASADIYRKHSAEWSKWDRCPSDEGETAEPPCVWDARHQGNGEGYSFRINMRGDVIRTRHRVAHCLVEWHATRSCWGRR